MTENALAAVVLLAAIFGAVHYCTLRMIFTGRGMFERNRQEFDADEPKIRIHR